MNNENTTQIKHIELNKIRALVTMQHPKTGEYASVGVLPNDQLELADVMECSHWAVQTLLSGILQEHPLPVLDMFKRAYHFGFHPIEGVVIDAEGVANFTQDEPLKYIAAIQHEDGLVLTYPYDLIAFVELDDNNHISWDKPQIMARFD